MGDVSKAFLEVVFHMFMFMITGGLWFFYLWYANVKRRRHGRRFA